MGWRNAPVAKVLKNSKLIDRRKYEMQEDQYESAKEWVDKRVRDARWN